jgi:2-aminoadipate transaminase
MDYTSKFSDRAKATMMSPIADLLKIMQARPDLISFAPGIPDTATLPLEMVEPLTKRVLEKYGRSILQYGLPQGFMPLREAVLPLLAKRKVICTADDIHISTGSSGGLNTVAMVLLNKGDRVLVETPTYLQAVQDFLAYAADVREVDCDEEGMIPDALEKELKAGSVKFIYLLPTFQNPTGRTMPLERRKQIAELAKKYNTLIIEDEIYYDFRFKGEHLPAIYSFAPEHTIYLGSVSKIFIPAARCGFAIMAKPLLEKVYILKQYVDMYTSLFNQALSAEFLSGDYQAHIDHLNQVYSAKQKATLEALKKYMPKGFSWNEPDGGLFIWLTGPAGFDAGATLMKAIEADVSYLPGSGFFLDQSKGTNTLRISYANPPLERIDEGIRRLASVLGTK